MKRILLVKTSSLGDVIHALPAVTDAKKQFGAGIQIDWVVEESFQSIPKMHPGINRTIVVALRRWRNGFVTKRFSTEWKDFWHSLRIEKYDAVIDAQGLIKSALIAGFSQGKRHGMDWCSVREPIASLFYQEKHAVNKNLHAIERIRMLMAQSLCYSMTSLAFGLDYGLAKPPRHAMVARESYHVFVHATTWASKHWPEAHWRQLAERFDAHGIQVVLPWHSDEEKQRCVRLSQGLECIHILPRCDLSDLAAVFSDAKSCVAVDTGLGHLSAAMNTPTLSLYGPTQPEFIGTYGDHTVHLFAEGNMAGKRDKTVGDMDKLSVDKVWRAWQNLMHT